MDSTFDNDDVIVLAFSPGSGATNDRRIDIYPNTDNVEPPAAGGAVPREVDYWTNSGTWNTGAAAVINPGWLVNNIRVSSGGPGNWNVEIKIPITAAPSANQNTDTGINIPPAGNFGFFFNVCKVDGNAGTVSQRAWPPGVLTTAPQPIADVDLDANTPAPANWGQASQGSTMAGGVYLTSGDIRVTNGKGTGTAIDYTGFNTFNATVHNASVDGSGNPVAVSGITAEFHIADFGINGGWGTAGDWVLIPAGNNPTSAQGIAASSQTTFSTAATQPSTQWPASLQNDVKANNDQCVLVELDSTNPNTLFLNKSTWQNMQVIDTHSPFHAEPLIDIKGAPLPRGAQVHEITLSEFHYNTPGEAKWESAFNLAGLQKIGAGQFKLNLNPAEATRVTLAATVTPPEIHIPRHVVNVRADDAHDTSISVEPGHVVSLFANGTVHLHPDIEVPQHPLGPVGLHLESLLHIGAAGSAAADLAARAQSVLQNLRFQHRPAGALVGSFDDFKTTFTIGAGTTIKVPQGASNLSLAINSGNGVLHPVNPGGFNVQITQTPVNKLNL